MVTAPTPTAIPAIAPRSFEPLDTGRMTNMRNRPRNASITNDCTTPPDGAVTAIWRRMSGSTFIVQTTTRPAGSNTWGATSDLSATGGDAEAPQIATAPPDIIAAAKKVMTD